MRRGGALPGLSTLRVSSPSPTLSSPTRRVPLSIPMTDPAASLARGRRPAPLRVTFLRSRLPLRERQASGARGSREGGRLWPTRPSRRAVLRPGGASGRSSPLPDSSGQARRVYQKAPRGRKGETGGGAAGCRRASWRGPAEPGSIRRVACTREDGAGSELVAPRGPSSPERRLGGDGAKAGSRRGTGPHVGENWT